MNKFDERYEIRLANASDIDEIMQFIDKYWSKGHIISQDKELFEYEYCEGNNVNFILAIDKKTSLIEGIFGFIRTSHTNDHEKKHIWGSMWKVNETHDNIPFLGIELAKRVYNLANCHYHIGNGANPNTTIPLRRLFFRDRVGKMKQYYQLNFDTDCYKIARIKKKTEPIKTHSKDEINIHEYHTIADLKNEFDVEGVNTIPFKDNWYINKRYFCHPYYKYKVYGLADVSGKIGAIMVGRVVQHNDASVFRIVDYIGNQSLFAGLRQHFAAMIKRERFEYIDFFAFGFDEQAILKAGFKLRDEDDLNIIPNYFEPFLQKNIDVWVHYKESGTTFFKADGDQDRPNQIKELSDKGAHEKYES